MQGDGQVPGGPPGPGNPFGNPFGHPFEEEQDPLDDPLSPFNKSPLGPMSNPLTGGVDPLDTRLTRDIQYPLIGPEMSSEEMLDQFERGIENTPPIQPGQDGIDRMLDELEGTIENTPPIRPGPDALRRKLEQLEETIENLPPEGGHIEPEIDMPQQDSVASGKGTDGMPPLPYYLENSQRVVRPHKSPHRSGGRIGRRGGKNFNSSQAAQGGEFYCPIENDYVSEDFCQDQDCEYYDEDWEQEGYDCPCTCDDEEDL